jgi:hypothetical protein
VTPFPEIWEKVKHLTLLNRFKAELIYDLLKTASLRGNAAECGVFRGGISALMELALRDTTRRVWAFDSFRGLPPGPRSPKETCHYQEGHMAVTEEALRNNLLSVGAEGVVVVPGWFKDTMRVLDLRLSFAHVDCDLYDSTITCIEHLYPMLIPGGFMVFDDYFDLGGGVKAALDEHLSVTGERLYAGYCDQVFLVKERRWDTKSDPNQVWQPTGKTKIINTLDGTAVDATVPSNNRDYLEQARTEPLFPELPGSTLPTAQSVAERINVACDFHEEVLKL